MALNPDEKVIFSGAGRRYVLDGFKQELCREGTPIYLKNQAWNLLVFFTKNHGRVISEDDLRKVIWGDTNIGDTNLSQLVGYVRRALEDNSPNRVFIKTMSRRGYQFIAKIEDPAARTCFGPYRA